MRRKTVNIRAAKVRQVDYTGHGQEEPWHSRAPPDDEYWRRANDMRWRGVKARVSYWATQGDWFGLKVEPTGDVPFATNRPPWGGVWHVTLGKTTWLSPTQLQQLKRLQAKYSTPQLLELHVGQVNDRGHAPLYRTDPLVNDPLEAGLNVMGRALHVTL